MSKRPAKRWTVDETKAFLIFYRARKEEMENHRKKRMAYAHILEDMLAAGFDPNIEVSHLEVKMATLMRSYKASKDNAKRTGASPCTAPFMEEMDDLFGDKPITTESEAFNVGVEYIFEDFETNTSWPTTLLPFESTDSADTPSTSRSAVVHQAKRAKVTRSEYFKKKLELKEREQEEAAKRWEKANREKNEYRQQKLQMLAQLINKSNEN